MNRLLMTAAAALASYGFNLRPHPPEPQLKINRPLGPSFFGFSRQNYGAKRGPRVPKAFRQHAKRYGSSVYSMIKMHQQIDVPMLDHGRDRLEARQRDFSFAMQSDFENEVTAGRISK